MVDKELNFLSKNNIYGIVLKSNPFQNIAHNILYSDGRSLNYGDPAEIFSAITEKEFVHFMKCAVTETHYTKEHYWFTFGYQPADFENEAIKENEVRIQYAGVDNTITKKDFYDLCLLLCNAKLNEQNLIKNKEISLEQLQYLKTQLEEKIKVI